MVSLIQALGVTLILRHVAAVIRYRAALVIDWVPLAWMGLQFVATTWVWWSLWDFAEVEWTYPQFFYLLAAPTVQFIAISMLVSTDVERPDASLADNFATVRLPFMLLLAAFQTLSALDGWIFGVEPFWNSLRILQLLLVGSYLAGAISSRRIVQVVLVVFIAAQYVYGLFVLRYLPAAFASS